MSRHIIGRHLRVLIDGHDISGYVRAMSVQADVDSVVTTHLELICGVSIVGEVVSLGAKPQQHLEVQDGGTMLRVRAITLAPLRGQTDVGDY